MQKRPILFWMTVIEPKGLARLSRWINGAIPTPEEIVNYNIDTAEVVPISAMDAMSKFLKSAESKEFRKAIRGNRTDDTRCVFGLSRFCAGAPEAIVAFELVKRITAEEIPVWTGLYYSFKEQNQ